MANNRNGMDPSGVPQGLVGQMLPMNYDGSGVTAAPIDSQRPGSTTLASALASATPENQRMVSTSRIWYYYTCRTCILFPWTKLAL